MSTLRADSPIQYIKGIGPARAVWFAAAGLHTVGDLLEYFPFRYEIDSGEVDIADLQPGMNATVRGEILSIHGRPPMRVCELHDGTETCALRWFRDRFAGQRLHVGDTVIASGEVQQYNDRLEFIHPRIQVFDPDAVMLKQDRGQRQIGVYRGTGELKTQLIRRAVQGVLEHTRLPVVESLPAELLRRHDFPSREAAIRQLHSPTDDALLQRARRRLAYEEFFLMELAMALRRRKRCALQAGQKLPVTPEIDQRIRARFPFPLTAGQDDAIREIVRDLESGRPMTRLLQGDVGCGKTVVALYACLAAIANGRQAALMAPTEILAQQHFRNIERYLENSRVRRVLLRGGQNRTTRAAALAAIERGEIDLVVGTQALIQSDVTFAELALVVIDEQHKFGVLQRHEFRTKGPAPHYLVMTATPIPRTLAMTVFGDLDVAVIRESPPGRGRIITRVVTRKQWPTVMEYVRKRLAAGEQAYVVCPVIGTESDAGEGTEARRHEGTEGDEPNRATQEGAGLTPAAAPPPPAAAAQPDSSATRSLPRGFLRQPPPTAVVKPASAVVVLPPPAAPLTSVHEAHEKLVAGPWRGLNVGLLHGALPAAQKDAAVAAFAAGRLHALVATTVVEVGVDVPNATIMIVEHADRFGLSQLHQLRGRVGRGSKDSLCVLIAHDRSPKSAERLAALAGTTDGFKIAEADLRLRGPGELFGTRQHGLPELRVGSLIDDFALLELARGDAFEIVAADPTFTRPEHAVLLPALRKMFGAKLALIDAA